MFPAPHNICHILASSKAPASAASHCLQSRSPSKRNQCKVCQDSSVQHQSRVTSTRASGKALSRQSLTQRSGNSSRTSNNCRKHSVATMQAAAKSHEASSLPKSESQAQQWHQPDTVWVQLLHQQPKATRESAAHSLHGRRLNVKPQPNMSQRRHCVNRST